ncbi:exo-beta-protein [Diplodia corticola]|uniref:Exo-beta-protein n=1 Tax=Diplodia corticola TaxID=236234 RepID=A0A1J9RN34_9PEZI|nr:exo-beta-protein [Diplodia corticola]OJD29911.1 exo-beta-protein [Diplodia corticola]
MISLQFWALVLAFFTEFVSAAPALVTFPKRYVSFDGFKKITNKDSLAWYRPYSPGVAKAVVDNPPDYQCFHGANYPYVTDWASFNTLWDINLPALRSHNSAANNRILRKKILQIAAQTKTDARIILAIIVQESSGDLGVRCTGEQKRNCGIMQASPGSVSFDAAHPSSSIGTMIRNGVLGTPGGWPDGGPGFAWLFNGADGEAWANMGAPGGGQPFRALRAFNTGKVVDASDYDETGGVGTVSYVNDVANRLMGWDGRGRGCGY